MAPRERKPATAEEFREVLDRALAELDADERLGPLLRAAGLAVRIELTDLNLVVRITTSEAEGHHLRWRFEDGGEPAKLELRMDSATANAYLQGKESLAIGLARRKVRCSGSSRVALFHLPALGLIVEPYRRLVRERFPHLALTP